MGRRGVRGGVVIVVGVEGDAGEGDDEEVDGGGVELVEDELDGGLDMRGRRGERGVAGGVAGGSGGSGAGRRAGRGQEEELNGDVVLRAGLREAAGAGEVEAGDVEGRGVGVELRPWRWERGRGGAALGGGILARGW